MWIFFLLLPILYLAGNIYIFQKGKRALKRLSKGVKLLLGLLFWVCALSFFGGFLLHGMSLPPILAQMISEIGTGWMVFTLYMTLALLIFDLLQLFRLRCPHSFLLSLLLTLSLLGYGYYHYTHPTIKTIDWAIHKPAGTGGQSLKIVAVSDLHLGYATNKKKLAGYVELINAQKPDLVLIGGDLIDNSVIPLIQEHMEEELAHIQAPLGIYMVPGNHEYISGIEESIRFIHRTPIRLLRDSVVVLPNRIQLVGRDDRHNKDRKDVERLTSSLDKSLPILLIDHQPYELEKAAATGADIQFSGHTHQGQVWPMSWLFNFVFELNYGEKVIGNTLIYVTSGLSLWGPPFRIGTDSELVVFNLTFQP